jgi:hypothetical protein
MKMLSEQETHQKLTGQNLFGTKLWVLEFADSRPFGSLEVRPYDGCRGLIWALVETNVVTKARGGIHVTMKGGTDVWYPAPNARLAV